MVGFVGGADLARSAGAGSLNDVEACVNGVGAIHVGVGWHEPYGEDPVGGDVVDGGKYVEAVESAWY